MIKEVGKVWEELGEKHFKKQQQKRKFENALDTTQGALYKLTY